MKEKEEERKRKKTQGVSSARALTAREDLEHGVAEVGEGLRARARLPEVVQRGHLK
jgi:hypothetical protein